MSVCLAAHTPCSFFGGYPPYISVNQHGNIVEVTVRSKTQADGRCGDTATIALSLEEFRGLFTDALVSSP